MKEGFWALRRALLRLTLLLTLLVSATAGAQRADPDAGKHLLREYAGSDNSYGLIKSPQIWPQLQRLLGRELRHLQANLDVSGAVDVVGGDLSVSGNAPHQGMVEEAVVCVNTYNLEVSAAIYSKGVVTAYSRSKNYDDLSRCIKTWITVANSERRAFLRQPRNVHMVAGGR